MQPNNFYVCKIVYSNVASLMAKYNDLCALVQQDKPDIILLAETCLTSSIPDGMVSLNGYTLFRRDRIGSKGGGVCIYLADEVLSTFHVSNIPTKTPGTESLFLKLSNKDTTLLLGCIYRPPSSVVDNDKILVESLSHLADSYATLLLFGDFNMPDITWPIDPRCSYKPSSQLFVDLLTHSHLRQLVTQPTRHRLNQNPSTLDLIVCSDDHSLTNLEYLAPIGISDHSTLKIDLQICQSPRRRTVSFTRTVTDYRAVNNDLAKTNWEALLSDESIVKNWSTFKNTLQSLLHRHTKSFFVKQSSTKPWINGRLLQQINRKRALWRTYKRSGSELDYRIHREFSNRLSTAIKEARCVYEKNVAEAKDAKKLYKYIRTKFTGPVSTPRLKNTFGEVLDNNKIIADTFADAFSNVFTIEPSGCLPKLNNICKPISFSDISFTTDVVHKKLKQLKVSKSPGPDLITAKTLHECADTLSEVLCILMKQSFDSGTLPADWKIATVRPIFKKGDKLDASNYRPISLTSVVSKIMESIIYDQLIKYLIDHHLIPNEQHGFLPGKSIQSNLLTCLSVWTREVDCGNSVDVIFLDFSKAFDKVPKRRLLYKLQCLGISGNLIKWIESFISERTFSVKVGDSFSRPVKMQSGVPQGSTLGPLLFWPTPPI
ncbi:hypothetical protein Zmor_018251 [Zophobas morio]|uniref:Reverse transcriptase domain-containing protein n=1 Tax=Zophobas morio TaxID=2755281 RepID=A0AA38IE18_9CUCU|nr:hypothetical protein Zmor_018251 [Zophobas morio]